MAVAAVADFRPKRVSARKLPRRDGATLELVPAPDILAEVANSRPGLFCVGFAAESGTPEEIVAAARRKMREKGANMFVANNAADAGRDDCQLTILSRDSVEPLPRQPKSAAAGVVVSRMAAEMSAGVADVSRETRTPKRRKIA